MTERSALACARRSGRRASVLGIVAVVCVASPGSFADEADLCDLLNSDDAVLVSGAGLNLLVQMCEESAVGETAAAGDGAPSAPMYLLDGDDVLVNAIPDASASTTQSETTIAKSGDTMVLGWNDSTQFAVDGTSFNGYAVSFDGGDTWDDRGHLPPVAGVTTANFGDPWLRAHDGSGNFYYASLATGPIGEPIVAVYTGATPGSVPDWPAATNVTPGIPGLHDKPAMDVDNSGGPFDGRVYVCWRQFFGDNNIKLSINDTVGPDLPLNHLGVLDITPVNSFADQGCFVEVDQKTGDVYIGWENFLSPRTVLARRSTDGGATFGPPELVATLSEIGHITSCPLANCENRHVLDGDIRVLEFISSMTVNPRTGSLHVVYSSDGDGAGADESDVFHVRCAPIGENEIGYCSAPFRLNSDATPNDQWHPYVDASPNGNLAVFWYDRRDDANNDLIDVYKRFSTDDGITWTADEKVTDVPFGVPPLCPNFDPIVSPCYMAEYNHIVSDNDYFYFTWGDNRSLVSARPDPDVFFEREPSPERMNRPSIDQKGSLLVYSKIELKWNSDGTRLLQDTIIDITNDAPDDVMVQGYFINGDIGLERICSGEPCEENIVQEFEPGWNTADCRFELTGGEPHFWYAANGSGKCQPFAVLDPDGPGRPDPETGGATRVLRGYALFFAVKFNDDPRVSPDGIWEEIRWNHLKGDAVIVDYESGTAWEHNAWAFQARAANPGERLPTPGTLHLDGIEYDVPFDTMLLDFYAAGSTVLSGGGASVSVNTDLTVHPVDADLRQDGCGPVMTKVEAEIWNEFESKFSGTRRCICCWDQTMLADWVRSASVPNHFTRNALRTDKGSARLEGLASVECDYALICGLDAEEIRSRPNCQGRVAGTGDLLDLDSRDAALLGLTTKFLVFNDGAGIRYGSSGVNLVGSGEEEASILLDRMTGAPESNEARARTAARTPSVRSTR